MNPCIAIIDANTLGRTALRNLLTDIYGSVEIHVYGNMDEFIRDSNRHFVHFFVSSDILFTCVEEFEMLKSKTIVTSIGPDKSLQTAGFRVMDISLPENELKAHLMQLQGIGNGDGHDQKKSRSGRKRVENLSSREKDVLTLMVKGLITKR
jgi:FixJ family two-component response regulator